MKENLEQRSEMLALYLIENHATVRAAAKKFGISKSTVHTVIRIGVGSIGCLSMRENETQSRKILSELHISM